MKKRFMVAALLALTIKGCLIYLAIRASKGEAGEWQVKRKAGIVNDIPAESLVLLSPSFAVNDFYTPPQGPIAHHKFTIDSNQSELVWITGCSIRAVDHFLRKQVSDDFIGHCSLDFNAVLHHRRWPVDKHMEGHCPGLFSFIQGQTALQFPAGFGFPVFSDEPLSIMTSVANRNLSNPDLTVRYEVRIEYLQQRRSSPPMKPLFKRSVFIMLPGRIDADAGIAQNMPGCLLSDSTYHSLTNYWTVDPGTKTYHYNVTSMMDLPYDSQLHSIGVQAHPFTQSLELRDVIADSTVFFASCSNFSEKTGLKNIESFSSQTGIPVFKSHEYELIVKVVNTSGTKQDMMAGMFLYFYDPEMDTFLTQQF